MDGGYITRLRSTHNRQGLFEVERPNGIDGSDEQQGSAREQPARVVRWG